MAKKAVIGSIMHKLAHLIYGVIHNDKPFDAPLFGTRTCYSRRYLTLASAGEDGLVFPTLYDAAIVWIGDGELRVRGFEINPFSQAHVAMAWAAEILEDQRPSRLLVSPERPVAISVITSQAELASALSATVAPPLPRC